MRRNSYISIFLFLAVFTTGVAYSYEPEKYLGKSVPGEYLHVHYPPDPVNPRTGNFYLPIQDLYLPCFGFPLEVFRAYNSFTKRAGPFGRSWSFNYDIKINIGGHGTLKIVESDGFVNEYEPKIKSKEIRGPIIEKIIEAKKSEDKKYFKRPRKEEEYDKIRIKLDTDKEYFQKQRKRYLNDSSQEVKDGVYLSSKRGFSTIVKSKDGYTRIRRDGTKELYDKKGYLIKVQDRNGNMLNFWRNSSGLITRVADACRHHIDVKYNRHANIIRIIDSFGRTMKYDYNKGGFLVKSVDALSNIVFYSYNKLGLLEKITFDKNQTTTIGYDKKGRVKKQAGPGDKVTKYRYRKRGRNLISTVVKDNKGYYEKFTYAKNENKTVRTDKKGNQTVTVISKSCSKPVLISNGKGKEETFEYDSLGQLVKKTDFEGNTYTYKYAAKFKDQVAEIKDQKGNKLTFLYDPRGNLTYANLNKKGWIKIRYEQHGKIKSLADNKGNLITFSYNGIGKPSLIEKKVKNKFVGSITVFYQTTGEIRDTQYKPNDAKIVNDMKKTINDMLELLRPSGIDFRM